MIYQDCLSVCSQPLIGPACTGVRYTILPEEQWGGGSDRIYMFVCLIVFLAKYISNKTKSMHGRCFLAEYKEEHQWPFEVVIDPTDKWPPHNPSG